MEQTLTPGDFISIIDRRKWALILPFITIAAISALSAYLLPSVYKSNAVILIEQREIPAEYVTSSMTIFAEQRMQSIKQRVLTLNQLKELIKELDLYKKELEKNTLDEMATEMRDKIVLEPINVEVADRKSGRTATVTIAFSLSFQGKNPKKTQKVVDKITTLFLEEDINVRTSRALDTHEFLQDEKNQIKQQLSEMDQKIAQFKENNANCLPESFNINMQALINLERYVRDAKENLRTLLEKKEQLTEELNNASIDHESILLLRRQSLEAKKMELINLKTKFSDFYPDVKKLEKELEELKTVMEEEKGQAQAHEELKNPVYVSLSARLAGLKSDIGSVKHQIDDLNAEADTYRKRLAAIPGVEEKYNALLMERNNLNAKYNELQAKMMEAKIAQKLELAEKGERFILIESALLPEKPFKPNRIAIGLIGVVLGLGAGTGLAALLEFSDASCRSAESLSKASGFPVLTVVPNIITSQDRKRRLRIRIVLIIVTLGLLIGGVAVFHFYIMDLNVFWVKLQNKIA